MESNNSNKVWLKINTPKGRARVNVSRDEATKLSTDPAALKEFLQTIHFESDANLMTPNLATDHITSSPLAFPSTSTNLVVSTVNSTAQSSFAATCNMASPRSTNSNMAFPWTSGPSTIDATDVNEEDDDEETEASGVWKSAATLLLIEEYQLKAKCVEKGKMTKKAMWGEIASRFHSKGYSFSSEQIAGRWKTLMRAYKKVKDNNKKSGSARKTFQFEEEMDKLLGNDPAVTPSVIISSKTSDSSGEKSDAKKVRVVTGKKQRSNCKTVVSELVETLKLNMKAQERRHEQKMEMFSALIKMQMKTSENPVLSASSRSRKRRREPTPSASSDDSD